MYIGSLECPSTEVCDRIDKGFGTALAKQKRDVPLAPQIFARSGCRRGNGLRPPLARWPHPSCGHGDPHAHDWTRPIDQSPPTHRDRHSRELGEGD